MKIKWVNTWDAFRTVPGILVPLQKIICASQYVAAINSPKVSVVHNSCFSFLNIGASTVDQQTQSSLYLGIWVDRAAAFSNVAGHYDRGNNFKTDTMAFAQERYMSLPLTFHWPNQVTWPHLASKRREEQSCQVPRKGGPADHHITIVTS